MSSQTGDFNVLTFPWTLQSRFSYLTVALIASVVALTESSSVSVPVIIVTQHNRVWLSFQHRRQPVALIWSHAVHPLHPSRNFCCCFFYFCNPWQPMHSTTKQTVSRLYYSVSGYFSCMKVSVQNVSSANTWLFGGILVGSSWPQCSRFFVRVFFLLVNSFLLPLLLVLLLPFFKTANSVINLWVGEENTVSEQTSHGGEQTQWEGSWKGFGKEIAGRGDKTHRGRVWVWSGNEEKKGSVAREGGWRDNLKTAWNTEWETKESSRAQNPISHGPKGLQDQWLKPMKRQFYISKDKVGQSNWTFFFFNKALDRLKKDRQLTMLTRFRRNLCFARDFA